MSETAGYYRKRPVIIEAIRIPVGSTTSPEVTRWLDERGAVYKPTTNGYIVRTLEGDMRAAPGWWLIKGIKGEVYPCEHMIFAGSYEPVGSRDSDEDATQRAIRHLTNQGYEVYLPDPMSRFHVSAEHGETSRAVERKIGDQTMLMRYLRMFEEAAARGDGLTDYELAERLGRSHQSASAGRNQLMRRGLLRPTTRTRVNEYGNKVTVWVRTARQAPGYPPPEHWVEGDVVTDRKSRR